MDKINEIKNEYKKICDDILKREDNLTKKDLEIVENFILKDNIEPKFILAYLKLIQKFKEKEEFLIQIEKYKYFLSKEIIDREFYIYKIQKISSSEIFRMLIKIIIKFSIQ